LNIFISFCTNYVKHLGFSVQFVTYTDVGSRCTVSLRLYITCKATTTVCGDSYTEIPGRLCSGIDKDAFTPSYGDSGRVSR